MKKRTIWLAALLYLSVMFYCHAATAQPLLYLSSGERVKNKYPAAGGSSCCNCKVRHYGNLPDDFPTGKVYAVTFYLNGSRSNSYYTSVQEGPTQLKLVLGDRQCTAASTMLADFVDKPVRHKWYVTFVFDPPADAAPRLNWEIADGDNNIYSAVFLHSSDSGTGGGLAGVDEQSGCQYRHKIQAYYSVRFDLSKPSEPSHTVAEVSLQRKKRDKILKTAIVEFTERGDLGIKDAGSIIAEWMTTALNRTGVFEVYERLSLNKLLEEHQMAMSGLMDEQTIAQIGKVRGVEAIVTGSVLKFGDVISVTVRLIDTETAKLIDTADVKVGDVNRISLEIDKLADELAME